MASIDALSGIVADKSDPEVRSNKITHESPADGGPDLTRTDSETPGEESQPWDGDALAQEGKERATELDDGDRDHRIEQDKLRQNDLATPGSEAASQSSQEEEDDVIDFIKVGAQGTSRNSPLFFSDAEDTFPPDLTIEVPEVQRRWEYRVFAEEYTIRSVLRELSDSREVKYDVRFEDGRTSTVSQHLAL